MQITEILEHEPLTLALPDSVRLSDSEFFQFCQLNRDWRFERNSDGEIVILAPASWLSSHSNSQLTMQLQQWANRDGTGRAFDSSGGFVLSNRSVRSPDAAWVLKSRIHELPDLKDEFLPLTPDFVVEMRSPSDRLSSLQAKLREYIDCGVRLGWLIDRQTCRVYVYRPDRPVETLDDAPAFVSADPELPGFILDLRPVWNPD